MTVGYHTLYYYYYYYYYAANAVGKDLDIFAIEAVSLNHIYTLQPKSFNNMCS
jgi:hypothetical protein